LSIEKAVTTHEGGNGEVKEVLDAAVDDIEVYSVSSMLDPYIQRIVHPFGVKSQVQQDLLVPSPSIRNILSAIATVAIDRMEFGLSVDDIFLIHSSAMRYMIAKEWSASKAPPGSIYDSSLILFGGNAKQATDGTLIGIYALSVTIDSVFTYRNYGCTHVLISFLRIL